MVRLRILWWLLLFTLASLFQISVAKHEKKLPSAMVVGTVYCDTCFRGEFSKPSHFISGASVAVECGDAGTEVNFRQEVRTNEQGDFKVHLPFSVGKHIKRIKRCSVKLISSNEPYCSVAATATSSSLHLKSRKQGIHIFSAGFFTFKPLKQPDLCSQRPNPSISSKFSSEKAFFPYPVPTFPPITQNPLIPNLPMPQLPTMPNLPPLPQIPQLPTMPNLPPLPQIPQLPTLPNLPPLPLLGNLPTPPSGPSFPKPTANLDEKTFFLPSPQIPFLPSPQIPFLPSPPVFGLPPNPLQPPSLLPPNPLQPPPSILPPNPLQPPSPPFFNLPPVPFLTPPPPAAAVLPFPFPPFPFPPYRPIFPGIPPATLSKNKSP